MDRFIIKQKKQRSEDNEPSTSQSVQFSSNEKIKKRKLYSFKDDWETEYFVVENPDRSGVICLLCDSHLAGFRRSNCERHFKTNHSSCNEQYPPGSEARSVKLRDLKQNLKTMITKKLVEENAVATLISYDISHILAKHSKPLSDGEIIKKCIVSAVERLSETLPDEFKKTLMSAANNIPLGPSNNTVTRRVEDISKEIKSNLLKKMASCRFMSLAIDESTDIGGVAQLLCYVRFAHDDGCVSEEFLGILPLLGRTTGEDIFNELMKFFKDNTVDLNKLISVATDGAPAMVGIHKSLISFLSKLLPDIIYYHCFIHVEVLCSQAQVEEVNNVLSVIVKLINFLITKPLNKRLLKLFLEEMQVTHNELVMHTDVRWLSKGKALSRVWELFDEVKSFVSDKFPGNFPEIYTRDFKIAFSFAVDLLSTLNKLNLELQGRNKLITDLFDTISAFQSKLLLFSEQLAEGLFHHFPELQKTLQEYSQSTCPGYVITSIINLNEEFQKRFENLKVHTDRFQLCSMPMHFDVKKLKNVFSQQDLSAAEMELCEIQSSTSLKLLHTNLSCENFWKTSDTMKFHVIRAEALKVLCLFGTTYVCEAAYSFMTNMKNKKRARLSQDHLEHCLRVALANNEDVNLEKLASAIQSQGSH